MFDSKQQFTVAHLPAALGPGDVIGVVAPASAFAREPFDAAVAWLRAQGFQVVYRDDIFERNHYLAGSVERRVEELHDMFSRPDVRAVVCARGGYGSVELLPHLDWELLGAQRKIFVGYSDLTPLLAALRDRSGLVSFHGPVLTGLVAKNDEESRKVMLEVLAGSSLPSLTGGQCLNAGQATGELVGGNLALMASTVGTPYQIQGAGRIVLLEDVGERPYRIDRMLLQLRQADFFDGAVGIAVGEFEGCESAQRNDRPIRDILKERLGDLPIPICYDFPFGHGVTTGTLPLGVLAHLNGTEGVLSFTGVAVRQPPRKSVGV